MRLSRLLFVSAFILFSLQLYAMPPHPDAVDQSMKDGQLKSLMNRVEAINNKQNMNSPLNIFPSSGTRRVPVLLVNFASSYQASPGLFLFSGNIKKENMLFYGLFLLSISALSFMIIKSAAGNNALPKPLIPVYLVLFVFIISCGVEDEKNEIVFPTDPSVYTKILNGSDLSVRRYYKDMSNNNLNLSFDIYGPVKVSKSWDYYGKNVSGNDSHPGELAGEAIRLMVTKYSSVNFSVYDNDIDGKVDSVIIIHDGPGEEVKTSITDLIWSHQWDLNSAYSLGDGAGPVYTDGVLFSVYTMQPEYTSSRGDSSMGVFAHEFGHVLGLPDLYDTSNQTYGVGNWSLMAHGAWRGPGGLNDGTTPAPLLAWERFKIGGASWITLTTLASETGKVIGDIETTKTAFKIVLDITPNEVQFLIVEGKQSSTSTQWYVPGPAPAGGLLITHIHEGVIDKYFDNPLILSDGNNVNAGDTRVHGVNILESDGTHLWLKSNTGTVSDLYTSGGLTNVNMYNGSYPTYLKASVSATTVDVNGIAGTLSPLSMTFNVVP